MAPHAQCRNDVTKHVEQMQKKRVVLCQSIDAAHSLANQ
jgi:ribosomal protein L7Ae-like RNA K-turn-binding protein